MAGVLVIGVDGVRFDALGADSTPNIYGLGVLGPVLIDEATPTWSGPCWATIATGVTVAEHNIMHNDFTGHRLAEFPDFVTLATRAGLTTLVAISGWPPLATAEDGGPLFAEVTRREFIRPRDRDDADAWGEADEATASLAASLIARGDAPDVSFVYLGAVDITGHELGVGPPYRAAVRAADRRVGRLVASVRARADGADWTIVVVTDHGHLDAGGHGGREPEVATAWAAVAGPSIVAGAPPTITRHVDIAPLVTSAARRPPTR